MKRISSAVSVVCLLAAIGITSFAILTSRVGWPLALERLSHFQLQYWLVVLVLTGVTLCLRLFFTAGSQSKRLLLAMFFCCAVLSVQIITWYAIRLPIAEAANYKVLSANLLIRNTNAKRILDLVQQEQPDLALFMEVNDQMGKQLETLTAILPYSSNQQTPYRLGTVLYSKTPLTDIELPKFNTRSAVHVTAHTQINGQPISLVGIHPFPPVNPELFKDRNQAFAAVGKYVKTQSDPVILMGDFNTTMWSPYYRQLARQTGLKNTRSHFGILPTWPSKLSYIHLPKLNPLTKLFQIPIDHCLASSALKVVGMHTGPDVGSDHLPIVIDFQLDKD